MNNNHKRRAETQLTADNYDDDGRYGDENFTTEPCFASAETMATRRILHVKRPNSITSTSTTSTDDSKTVSKNPFQFLNVKMPETTSTTPSSSSTTTNNNSSSTAGAATAQPFTFTSSSTNATNPFTAKFPLSAFSNQPQTSTQPLFATPLPSTNTTNSDAYKVDANGNKNLPLNSHQENVKPVFTFNFGNIPQPDNDNQNNNNPKRVRLDESTNLETQTTNKEFATKLPGPNVQKQNEPFKFNFLAQPETTKSLEQRTNESIASDTLKKDGSGVTNPFTSASPLFGGGAFNFKGAVNSFVEARKKMEQQNTFLANNANVTNATNGSGDNVNNMHENSVKDSSENVEETDESIPEEKTEVLGSGELIISVPVKLYCFVKDDKPQGEWVERGVGDAKLKRVDKKQGTATAQEVKENTNDHNSNAKTGDDKSTNDKNANRSATSSTTDKNSDNSKGNTANTNEKGSEAESKNASNYIYRFLVRDGYSLNVTVGYKTLVINKQEQKHIVFTVNTTSGLHTYLLKFTGANAESNCVKFTEELKKINANISQN